MGVVNKMSRHAKHRAEKRKTTIASRIKYAKNRWHLHYKPAAKKLMVVFMTKGTNQ
jgi:hypothetical protein